MKNTNPNIVAYGVFYKGVLQDFAYNQHAAVAIMESYGEDEQNEMEVLPLQIGVAV